LLFTEALRNTVENYGENYHAQTTLEAQADIQSLNTTQHRIAQTITNQSEEQGL